MTARPPFEIELQIAPNIVYTRYFGSVSAAHMSLGVDELSVSIAQMKKGFTVLADLSQLEKMDLDCAPHLSRIMEISKVHGVGRVIRVVPDRHKDIGFNILSLIHYRGKIPIITCDTLAEAERALAAFATSKI